MDALAYGLTKGPTSCEFETVGGPEVGRHDGRWCGPRPRRDNQPWAGAEE